MNPNLADEPAVEEYLQISPNILASFPRFRPPVGLYQWNDEMARVELYIRAGQRLDLKAQDDVARICSENRLYLYRGDYREYAKHLSEKLGLVLTEHMLNDRDVSEIFFQALGRRVGDFFDQPMEDPLEALKTDLSVLCEYIWINPSRVEFLLQTLGRDDDLAFHAVNSVFVGLGIHVMGQRGKFDTLELNTLALGLAIHDLGMVRVPGFIRGKSGVLMHRDRESVRKHPDVAETMLRRLGVTDPVIIDCVMQHHERMDGSGYPGHLKDVSLSYAGRLCAVADSFSAATSERAFRAPRESMQVARLLASDKKYDSDLTARLLELLQCGFEGCSLPPDMSDS